MTLYEQTVKRESNLDDKKSIYEAYMKVLNPVNEETKMSVSDFVSKLESTIKKIFPKSFIRVAASKNLGSSIDVTFTLGKDKSQWENGIIHNDPLHHKWMVGWNSFVEDSFVKDKIEAEISLGGSLTVEPEEGSHMAFGRVKIGWRKKTSPPDKIIKHFENYFKKMKKVLMDNKDKLPQRYKELNKNKI